MQISDWIQIGFICFLGAISPGPSLAFIFSVTMARSRSHGVMASIGHGIGISLWAFITVLGIAQALLTLQALLLIFQLAGILLLIYIGIQTLRHKYVLQLQDQNKTPIQAVIFSKSGAEGFLLSLSNPKIAVFFVAIFSQFVSQDTAFLEMILIGAVAGIIDAAWYSGIALVLTKRSLSSIFQARESLVRRSSGALLIGIAIILGLRAVIDFI